MNKVVRNLLIFLFVTIAGVAVMIFLHINKSHPGVSGDNAEFVMTADSLLNEFTKNETGFDKKYSGKILLVKGNVGDVNISPDSSVSIILKSGLTEGTINCSLFDKNSDIDKIQAGNMIKLKGICTGAIKEEMLDDILINISLNRCEIVK